MRLGAFTRNIVTAAPSTRTSLASETPPFEEKFPQPAKLRVAVFCKN